MTASVVRVPDALLFHGHLGKSAKMIWMVLQLVGSGDTTAAAVPGTGLLHARSGLARHTVLQALSQLRAWGWLSSGPNQGPAPRQGGTPGQGEAHVPADLLLEKHVGVQARLLYACLQRTPGFQSGRGQCTGGQLCSMMDVSPGAVKRAVRALRATGWLEISQRTKFSPIAFFLNNPVASEQKKKLAWVVRGLKAASYRGEALMRAYLSLLVNSDEHDDDASPSFLVNPFTGEEMQLDRYYPGVAAFEFQGPQHDGPTDLYPDETQVLMQQTRDHMKKIICAQRAIHLVVVHAEDLSLEGMQAKVAGLLPLRKLEGQEAVIAYLEKVSRSYRQSVREGPFHRA